MTVIASVRGELPEHRYDQAEITAMFASLLDDPRQVRLLERLHASAQVRSRHLALPLERYRTLNDFGAANDEFLRVAADLAVAAVSGALADAGLAPADVDIVFSTTVTGVAAPSLEARIAERL